MTQMRCLTGASILAPRDNAPKRETSGMSPFNLLAVRKTDPCGGVECP